MQSKNLPATTQEKNDFEWSIQPDVSSTITTEIPHADVAAQAMPFTTMHSRCDSDASEEMLDGRAGWTTIVKSF